MYTRSHHYQQQEVEGCEEVHCAYHLEKAPTGRRQGYRRPPSRGTKEKIQL